MVCEENKMRRGGSRKNKMCVLGGWGGWDGVCESYLSSTGLHCAPLTYVVHHGAQGGRPQHFFLWFTCTKWTLFVGCSRALIVTLWLTPNMQIKVHNVVLYRLTLWKCTT